MRRATIQQGSDRIGTENGRPLYLCHLTPRGGWAFRCECGKVHTHGPVPGHRRPHCGGPSYYLAPPIEVH